MLDGAVTVIDSSAGVQVRNLNLFQIVKNIE